MKQKRTFVCGVAIGLIIATGVTAFGAPTIEKITAYINHEFEFEFDGTRKALPDGYHVLVYEGRSYVPAKFVAENLNATVEWNDTTKMISIRSPEPVIVTVPAIAVPEEERKTPQPSPPVSTDTYNYKVLPQTKDFVGFHVSALSYLAEPQDIGDRLYLNIKNSNVDMVQIDQMETKIIADGKVYKMSGNDAGNFDRELYKNIRRDETVEGYLYLPPRMKDVKNLHIELMVNAKRNAITEEHIVEFDIAL